MTCYIKRIFGETKMDSKNGFTRKQNGARIWYVFEN